MSNVLVGVLVGSLLTILAQWFLGPIIERRVRAQERWEQFVIELATLLDGPVKQAHGAARRAEASWRTLHEYKAEHPDLDPERFRELNDRDRAAFREALEAWSASMVRVRWLVERISGDYRLADEAVRIFRINWLNYYLQQTVWNAWDDHPQEDPPDFTRVDRAHKDLGEKLEVLTARIGAPVGPIQRSRAAMRSRREKRAAKRKAASG